MNNLKVWKDWATNRNMRPDTLQEKYPIVPVEIASATVDVISFWLPKFIMEVCCFKSFNVFIYFLPLYN